MNDSHPESPYSSPRDELAVVQLYSLQALAAHQVLQGGVRYQGAVVQLQDGQGFRGARTHPQVADAFVCDQFAMGQTLSKEKES